MKSIMNLEVIQAPKIENRNSIKGTLPSGEAIEVARRMAGFEVRILVLIDGFLIHDSDATKEDCLQWTNLEYRASIESSHNHDAKRSAAYKAGKACGLFA